MRIFEIKQYGETAKTIADHFDLLCFHPYVDDLSVVAKILRTEI